MHVQLYALENTGTAVARRARVLAALRGWPCAPTSLDGRTGRLPSRLEQARAGCPDSLARSRRPAAAGATLAVSLCTGGACRPVSSRARHELVAARAGRQRGDGLSVGLGVGFAHAEALLRVQGRGGLLR